jgi:hypothetical protein
MQKGTFCLKVIKIFILARKIRKSFDFSECKKVLLFLEMRKHSHCTSPAAVTTGYKEAL